MDIKLEILELAVKAAKEIQLPEMPWAWIKYLQSGWQIQPFKCDCGCNYVWFRPRPVGEMARCGCIAHTKMDISKLLDSKRDINFIPTRDSMLQSNLTIEDVGKLFYTFPESDNGINLGRSDKGIAISREDFNKLDPAEVGWWIEIDEGDIRHKEYFES